MASIKNAHNLGLFFSAAECNSVSWSLFILAWRTLFRLNSSTLIKFIILAIISSSFVLLYISYKVFLNKLAYKINLFDIKINTLNKLLISISKYANDSFDVIFVNKVVRLFCRERPCDDTESAWCSFS